MCQSSFTPGGLPHWQWIVLRLGLFHLNVYGRGEDFFSDPPSPFYIFLLDPPPPSLHNYAFDHVRTPSPLTYFFSDPPFKCNSSYLIVMLQNEAKIIPPFVSLNNFVDRPLACPEKHKIVNIFMLIKPIGLLAV